MNRERDLTFEERRTWDRCPTCNAPDGERCDPNVGPSVGRPATEGGVHLSRIVRAPMRVREVPV